MVTHIATWNFKDEVMEADREALKAEMKKNLESLSGKIPGLLSVCFIGSLLSGSNRDMAVMTTHEKAEDIEAYSKHPEHIKVADAFVRPYTKDRCCINF